MKNYDSGKFLFCQSRTRKKKEKKHDTIEAMKEYFFMSVFFLKRFFNRGTLFFLGVFFIVSFPLIASAETVLSEEALADLVKPSVVRIAEHVTGTAKIPQVKVDIRRRYVALVPERFTEVPVDEYLSGSGFVIHPDGYIATNAHVVSLETIKTSLASESALSAIYENALLLSDQETQSFLDDQDGLQFTKEIVRYIIDHSEFDLKHEIAVMRPGSKETKIQDLITTGFQAEVISVNEHFLDDERDVALLKIEENNLPALSLGSAEDFSVGKKVFIFGFPATAEINEKNPSEATFTRGIVSAIKQTTDGQLKIFQTDAKVSQGSSGGPLFNEYGAVLGMITFQTDELTRSAGDNFAFALPVEIVAKQADEARVIPEEGEYSRSFKLGFGAFLERHCDKALASFEETKKTNSLFLPAHFVASYVQKCQEWQSQGQARDTYWGELRMGVGALSSPILYILGGAFLAFGLLGGMMFWLVRQLRCEEQEIISLQNRLRADEQELRRHEKSTEDSVGKGKD